MFPFFFYVLALGIIKKGYVKQKKGHKTKYKIVGFKDGVTFSKSEGILANHGIKIKKHYIKVFANVNIF